MTTYNQWCVSKIYFQNIMCNVIRTDKFYKLHKIASTAVAGRHTLWRKEQRCPPAHFCVNIICIITNNAVPIQYLPDLILFITFHPTHHCVFIKYFLYPSHPKICVDILMRCAVNSIFDFASVPIKYLPKTLPPISRPQICEEFSMRNA